jgi:hypothetical protein
LCTPVIWLLMLATFSSLRGHSGHLKCLAIWCWMSTFSSSKSRLRSHGKQVYGEDGQLRNAECG